MKFRFVLSLACLALSLRTVFSQEMEGSDSPAGNTNHVVHIVIPSQTDPAINTFSGQDPAAPNKQYRHWAFYNPLVPERHRLVIFLPGTGGHGRGANGGQFNDLVPAEGFHLISLAYPSNISINHVGGGLKGSDPDAFLKARENILYGKAPFGKLAVTEPNSICNRLQKLLRFLAKNYPQEHWDQYLESNHALAWSKLILSGQSQGGGHAALLGMQHRVARVLCFGAPKDHVEEKPAQWYAATSATPLDHFFCFNHSLDDHNGATYAQQLENYRALKLAPRYPVVNVDEASAPYQHSRLLTTQRPAGSPHTAVISDAAYRVVWKYMLEEPVE